MRKNMIFGMIGFVLAVVTCGQALAALGPNDVSMGVFSIPLPGCAPEVTISEKDTSSGCYTMTVQNKTLQNGVCSSSGITPTTKQVCDGKDGENGAGGGCDSKTTVTGPDSNGCYTVTYQKMKVVDEECVEDGVALTYTTCDGATEVESEAYIPYPLSMTYDTGNDVQIGHEGYRRLAIKFKGDTNSRVLKFPDLCEEFDNEDGERSKKCVAQGNATNWPNTFNVNPYQAGDSYVFVIGDLESGFPRYEYTAPRLSGGTTGYPMAAGFTQKVYAYADGRRVRETGATDECKEYAKPDNQSARVTKCTVQDYQYPASLLTTWVPNTTTYCLGNHLSDCNQYTIPVGAVDVCAGLTSSDNAWETTVTATESEYVAHDYSSTCTTNCTGTVGYKLTTEKMCDGNERTNKVYDTCSSATAPSNVTCATGYAYQQCTPVDSRASANSYSGCFPDPLNGKYALKDEIVPVSLAADNDYLYYCKVSDCNVASCWVNGTVGGTPYYNDGNGCWGRVSVQGLQGENGESCFVMKDGTDWKKCCSPSYAGNDCSVITDQDVINKLNGMMCQVNYTHKYLHDDGNGGFTANTTKDGARGERVIVTNSCNDSTENLDTYYGEDATIEEYDGWPKVIYFAPQKSNGKLVKPGYTKVEHKYLRDGGATTMDSAQTVDSPCITVSKQTRTASGDTVTTQKQTVQKCQIQSYGELSSDSTGTWPTGNWYCLNTNASGSCDGYSDTISDEITSTLKYHLPIMGTGTYSNTPLKPGYTYNEEASGTIVLRGTNQEYDKCETVLARTNSGSSTVTASVTRCTVGAPTGTPGLNSTYAAGKTYCLNYANGTCPDDLTDIGSAIDDAADNDPCASVADNATLAAKTVKKTEYEYIAKGATGNDAGVGYVKKTKIMCDDTSSVPHEEDEYIYDTCVPQAQASGCNGASDKNYKCYKQNEAYNSASREYDACNPKDTAVALSSAVANKLDSDVTFTTGTYNNKDYILMSATGITNKPVVPVDELKPQSLFEIWKDQYKDLNNTSCSALFGAGKTCSASGNNLNESDMLANMNAYGVWKTDQVVTKNQTDSSNLTFEKYQQSLQPCQTFDISEDETYTGNDGKRYTMTCVQ